MGSGIGRTQPVHNALYEGVPFPFLSSLLVETAFFFFFMDVKNLVQIPWRYCARSIQQPYSSNDQSNAQ